MASPRLSFPRRDRAGFQRLRDRIRTLEGNASQLGSGEEDHCATFCFGTPDIDGHLPWKGLPKGALHEVVAEDSGAATSFSAALIGRLAAADTDRSKPRPVLWCESRHVLDAGGLYVPGLARFGLDPERMILVRARRDEDALWAMEEGLRCGSLGAVLGEVEKISLTAGRRLQLAAAEGGVTAFLLTHRAQARSASAAMTRWRVGAAADQENLEPGLGPTRWDAELFRCRGGGARTWTMEWCDETGHFAVAAEVFDRPSLPRDSRLAG